MSLIENYNIHFIPTEVPAQNTVTFEQQVKIDGYIYAWDFHIPDDPIPPHCALYVTSVQLNYIEQLRQLPVTAVALSLARFCDPISKGDQLQISLTSAELPGAERPTVKIRAMCKTRHKPSRDQYLTNLK